MPEYVRIYDNRKGSEYVSYNTQFEITLQVNEYLLKVFTALNEYSKYLMSTLELGHFDEHFIEITRKRDYARKHFEVFSLGNLTQR